jgi:hypothetical protein
MNIFRYFHTNIFPELWNIGFVFNFDVETFLADGILDIHWIKDVYKDRWFADPFILDITEDAIIILAEEFYIPRQKGRITKLVINKVSLRIESMETVLELETHLSFPAIFRSGDAVYVYPENSQANRLILYQFDFEKNTLLPVSQLIDEPLADAVILPNGNTFYLFATKSSECNGNTVSIYKSGGLEHKFEFAQSFRFSDNSARSAGAFIRYNNKFIRPAQDCNTEYGKGIVLQELISGDNTFSFRELRRIYPASKKWYAGLHTLNVCGKTAVIDGKRYKNTPIRKLYFGLKNNFQQTETTIKFSAYCI